MAGFKLYTSNRLESLCDALAGVVGEPLPSPLTSEVIIVQSRGMERWLSMELARRFGVWMNCRFPFPNRFVWEMFKFILSDVPDISMFSPQTIVWRIMGLLPEYLDRPAFDVLLNYLSTDGSNLKRFQLSERIADVFDRYAVYRPEMVLRWEMGKDEDWQAQIWRALVSGQQEEHRAALWSSFIGRLGAGEVTSKGLPERISIFGVPVLPHYHFEALYALASIIDIHFFLMSPTKEYWADIVPPDRMGPEASRNLYFETGNPLLASMGKLGKDFFAMILTRECEEFSSFDDPGNGCLLTSIQSDILNLYERPAGGAKTEIRPDDESVQVHSCHSPMREIEVLYDSLLDLFSSHDDLTPKDIIVMTPDIDTYAPYITAVFSSCQDEKRRIPFSIADKRASSESQIIDVFLKILGLSKGRCGAPEILDVLDSPVIQERFGFEPGDMDLILRWVGETGIRWGIDEEHRRRLGVPPFVENSWKAGTERLLLGYALRGDGEALFEGILPYNDMEGNEARILGRFLEFLRQLFLCLDDLEKSRTLTEWSVVLESLLARFVSENEENQREIQVCRAPIADLRTKQEISGFEEPLELDVIRYYLVKRFRDEELTVGFMTGAVTFCEMLPMRSVPFRVVALMGMNSTAYPREYRPVGFDLMAHDPRPGDRSLRDEDRYLFLEAILSARDYLYISYVGQSIRDNSEMPPSVLVSELTDYVAQGFEGCGGRAAFDHVVRKHRLQPFSPLYFSGDERLFSFSDEDCEIATIEVGDKTRPASFITRPLAKVPADREEVSVSELKRFYRNPARYFMNTSLGMYLSSGPIVPGKDESFEELDTLQEFKLKEWLTEKSLAGDDPGSYYHLARAQGILPPATPGRVAFQEIADEAASFAENVRSHTDTARLAPLDIDITIDGFRVTGRLDNIRRSTLVDYRCVEKDRAWHHLNVWIDHVVLNCIRKRGYPQGSVFVRIGGAWFFNPVENAHEVLKTLILHYRKGLREPLRFFPQSSEVYAERSARGKGRGDALKAARAVWEGSDYARGEGADPYLHLCFGHVNPLDAAFETIALDVFRPLIKNRDKLK
ncbi:MAG: RecBCD enzyme subunit RecC [Syntrophorhabdus sp. PtaU1.Bin050]|nr:MAG: RecBCD enzyme subunit RecC [Syntrophorhabdus sp. PtaU1.Bin050]